MSFTLDSNVLVYALDGSAGIRHEHAREILVAGRDADLLLTAQAVAETLNVIRRKYPSFLQESRREVERWGTIYPVLPTGLGHVLAAERFAAIHRLQLWDCVIWQVARSAGADFFISEDLQDGLSLDGMTVIDPFDSANEAPLQALLQSAEDG